MPVSSADTFGPLGILDATVELVCSGMGTVGFQISGTWVGTLTFEGTVDHANWQALNVNLTNSTTQVTTTTSNGLYTGPCAGLRAVRVRCSAYTSGEASVQLLVAGTGGGSGGAGGGGGGGGAVTIADGADVAEGATTDGAVITDTTGTVSGKLRGLVKWAFERMPASLGQKLMAASFPVTIASDQSGVPVTGPLTDTQLRATPVPVSLASAPTTSVTQGTTPWLVAGQGTAGSPGTAVLTVQGIASGTAQPVSAASLPLPSGASTLAEQQTQTTSLQLLDDAVSTTGSAVPAKGFQATGTDGTNARALKTDSSGELQVDVLTLPTVTVASKTIYQQQIYGSAQTVFNSSTDIAAGQFSAAGTDFTNNDGTIGCAPYASAMIEMPDWAAAPVAGTTVDLWGLLINVDGTDDDTDAPSGTASGGARYLGSWVIAAADALQRRTITISLAGIQNGFTPYVKNGTGQNMNNDAGTNMVVKITPWTFAQVG